MFEGYSCVKMVFIVPNRVAKRFAQFAFIFAKGNL